MEGKYKSLVKNTLILTISNFSTKLLSFFLLPLYTALLTTEEYGTFDLINTTIFVLMPLLTLNIIDSIVIFKFRNHDENKIIKNASNMMFISIVLVSIFLVFVFAFDIYSLGSIWYILFFLYSGAILNEFLNEIVKAKEKMIDIGVAAVVCSGTVISLNLLFLLVFKMGFMGFLLATTIGYWISAIYLCIRIRFLKTVFTTKTDKKLLKGMIVYSLPLIATTIGWIINTSGDKYISTFIFGVGTTGLLAVAYKIPTIVSMFNTIFSKSWQVSAVKEYNSDNKEVFYKNVFSILNCGLTIVAAGLIAGDLILAKFLFSNEFYEAWKLVPFLVLSSVFTFSAGYFGPILCADGKNKVVGLSVLLSAILNVGLNIGLAYLLGAQGLTIATMISALFIYVYRKIVVRHLMPGIEIKVYISWALLIAQATLRIYTDLEYLNWIILAVVILLYSKEIIKLVSKFTEKIRSKKKMKKDSLDYIIVQAGGKGTRMEKLTRNKPKALVPVNNLPMIMHLFKRFPNAKYVIIGDYKISVLEKYLAAFATVDYQIVNGNGGTGTCAGLKEALEHIPDKQRFMLIWCDLILPEDYQPLDTDKNTIGISKDFPCRWMYCNGEFKEERSSEYGVAGQFVFQDKSYLKDVPDSGEFVRWLQSMKYTFVEQPLYKTHEYGLYSEWEKLPQYRCRPFNKITIVDDKIIKEPITEQGAELAKKEIDWYKKASEYNLTSLPKIYSFEPFTMERIDGKNIYEFDNLSVDEKKEVLNKLISSLKSIHAISSDPYDENSYRVAYIEKTFDRLAKVKNLIPFASNEFITINNVKCRNVFFLKEEVEKEVMNYKPKEFKFIHGDCTFSNILLDKNNNPIFIDPRGYFGNTKFYGDESYDWVKLYYSLKSNYDQFNLKRFDLYINDNDVTLTIKSNGWEELEDYFFELLNGFVTRKQMKLFLAIIWLSLTTYAWEDYDTICGAFYNGLLYLQEALNDE